MKDILERGLIKFDETQECFVFQDIPDARLLHVRIMDTNKHGATLECVYNAPEYRKPGKRAGVYQHFNPSNCCVLSERRFRISREIPDNNIAQYYMDIKDTVNYDLIECYSKFVDDTFVGNSMSIEGRGEFFRSDKGMSRFYFDNNDYYIETISYLSAQNGNKIQIRNMCNIIEDHRHIPANLSASLSDRNPMRYDYSSLNIYDRYYTSRSETKRLKRMGSNADPDVYKEEFVTYPCNNFFMFRKYFTYDDKLHISTVVIVKIMEDVNDPTCKKKVAKCIVYKYRYGADAVLERIDHYVKSRNICSEFHTTAGFEKFIRTMNTRRGWHYSGFKRSPKYFFKVDHPELVRQCSGLQIMRRVSMNVEMNSGFVPEIVTQDPCHIQYKAKLFNVDNTAMFKADIQLSKHPKIIFLIEVLGESDNARNLFYNYKNFVSTVYDNIKNKFGIVINESDVITKFSTCTQDKMCYLQYENTDTLIYADMIVCEESDGIERRYGLCYRESTADWELQYTAQNNESQVEACTLHLSSMDYRDSMMSMILEDINLTRNDIINFVVLSQKER